METKNTMLEGMSAEDKAVLLAQLQKEKQAQKLAQREAYEGLRATFVNEVKRKVEEATSVITSLKAWLDEESESFLGVMGEYGQLRHKEQASFTVVEGDFKVVVSSQCIKDFDERAELASTRLIAYLDNYVSSREGGTDDPIYQLAMQMLERGKRGTLDYKNISRLYSLEDKFDEEYRAIMDLFRESHTEKYSVRNYYFYTRTSDNRWERIEPSFCRL